jgi:hypothetical protein
MGNEMGRACRAHDAGAVMPIPPAPPCNLHNYDQVGRLTGPSPAGAVMAVDEVTEVTLVPITSPHPHLRDAARPAVAAQLRPRSWL